MDVMKVNSQENKGMEGNRKMFDLSRLKKAESKSISKEITDPGAMTVINSKNGKRVTIAAHVMEKLGNPSRLQFAFDEDIIAVGEILFEDGNTFLVKRGKEKESGKALIYAAELVEEITNEFSLVFNPKVSITFHDVEYISNGDCEVALITVEK